MDLEKDDRTGTAQPPMGRAQPDVPFKLMVRPFTTVGVDTRYPFTLFEDELRRVIQGHIFDSQIRIIVVTPTIIDRTLAVPTKDYVKFNKKEGSVFVGKGIDYRTWEHLSQGERLEIFAVSVRNSLLAVSPTYITASDCEFLVRSVDQILPDVKARLLN